MLSECMLYGMNGGIPHEKNKDTVSEKNDKEHAVWYGPVSDADFSGK